MKVETNGFKESTLKRVKEGSVVDDKEYPNFYRKKDILHHPQPFMNLKVMQRTNLKSCNNGIVRTANHNIYIYFMLVAGEFIVFCCTRI